MTEGQAHDGRSAADLVDAIGPGRILLADQADESDALPRSLHNRGAWASVKPMLRRVTIPSFSPLLYRDRKLVERFFNKLRHFRAVTTRLEKHAAADLALIKLAASRIWLRAYESVT